MLRLNGVRLVVETTQVRTSYLNRIRSSENAGKEGVDEVKVVVEDLKAFEDSKAVLLKYSAAVMLVRAWLPP